VIATVESIANLSDYDRREVLAFRRFLEEVDGPATPAMGQQISADHPGWIPYVLGDFCGGGRDRGLHPPERYGGTPCTAWTFPG
jgi:hypothetical protein